jgi:hypothetical protein
MPDSRLPRQGGPGEEGGAQCGDHAEAEHHQVEHDRGRQPGLAAGQRSATQLRREAGKAPRTEREQRRREHAEGQEHPTAKGLAQGERRDGEDRPGSAHPPGGLTGPQDPQQPLLQGDPRRLDCVHPDTQRGEVVHEVGDGRPLIVGQRHVNQSSVRATSGHHQPGFGSWRHLGQVQSELAPSQQLGKGARGGGPPPVEDDDPVADALDLPIGWEFEEHGDAALLRSSTTSRTSARPSGSKALVGSSQDHEGPSRVARAASPLPRPGGPGRAAS